MLNQPYREKCASELNFSSPTEEATIDEKLSNLFSPISSFDKKEASNISSYDNSCDSANCFGCKMEKSLDKVLPPPERRPSPWCNTCYYELSNNVQWVFMPCSYHTAASLHYQQLIYANKQRLNRERAERIRVLNLENQKRRQERRHQVIEYKQIIPRFYNNNMNVQLKPQIAMWYK